MYHDHGGTPTKLNRLLKQSMEFPMRDLRDSLTLWLMTDLFLIIGSTLIYLSRILPTPINAAFIATSVTFFIGSFALTILAAISAIVGVKALKKGGVK
jgi:ABC-type transport system involved in cytochrome c biogenesis permease component